MHFSSTPLLCKCGVISDTLYHHAMSCRFNHLFQRHESIVASIHELCQIAGINSHINPKQYVLDFNPARSSLHYRRPGDIIITPPTGPTLCIDVTCVSPLTTSRSSKNQGRVLGFLASEAAINKKKLYEDNCAMSGMDFLPFSLDPTGILHSDSFHLLNQIALGYSQKNGMTFSHARMIILRRISFTLQRSIAIQILNLYNNLTSTQDNPLNPITPDRSSTYPTQDPELNAQCFSRFN